MSDWLVLGLCFAVPFVALALFGWLTERSES